jgi:hypothetical protein
MDASSSATDGTPVAWPLRAWFVVELLFGLAAVRAIFLAPDQAHENFAWPITPVVMAAVLGAFYLATGLALVFAIFARRWEHVRVVVVSATIFTTVMLIATVLHWDRFSVRTLPFYVWLASYLLPPPVFVVLFWWHQRRASPIGMHISHPLPRWFRSLCWGNGAAYVAVSALLFLFPRGLIGRGPWAFTPLTVRTLCGFLIAAGLIMVGIAWENDWRRARIGTVMLVALGPALVVQLLRYREQVDWSNIWLLVDGIDFLLFTVIVIGLWIRDAVGQRRPPG